MAVIGIDLGTTGCKAAVFDGGRVLGSSYRRYDYSSPREGWAEQDAAAVWTLVEGVVAEALASCAPKPAVAAVCVSVQGDAIIPVDREGNPIHPAVLGMDIRSHQEAAGLEAAFGRERLFEMTGMPCEPLNAITKVWWLERNRPEVKARVWKYLHYGEFLLLKLAGAPALDLSMASRTMAFDPVDRRWQPSILEHIGVDPSKLGDLAPCGAAAGTVLPELAARWGITPNAVAVPGGHDQCMAAIGAGMIGPGIACYSMGTAEVISACFAGPRLTPAMLAANYPCYRHATGEHYFTISLNQSGGLSLEWLGRNVLGREGLADLIAGVKVDPSPVVFLPHIVGSGTPACDHLSRGAFLGLRLKHGREEMFQAAADALAFEARVNLENLDSLGIRVDELRAVGGGARSGRMLELKATVLKRPIRTLANPEAALVGAAMLAQVATGQFRDLAQAREECVRIERTVEPLAAAAAAYEEAFARFRPVYGMLKDYYHQWRDA